MEFEGVYTPLITPYHDDFSLNEDALAETVELLIGAGVHGLIIAGTTGESATNSRRNNVSVFAINRSI